MKQQNAIKLFEDKKGRTFWDAESWDNVEFIN